MTQPFGEIPRPNWIEIDLDNLQHNICYIKSLLPSNVKILLPVKADAYGHGSLAISFAAIDAGIDFLGVAHLFEGVALRENNVNARVLILGPCMEEDFLLLVKYNLTPSIQDFKTAEKLSNYLSQTNKKQKIHIQIDSGMHRFGIDYKNIEEVVKIFSLCNLEVEGIYSHFANADIQDKSPTKIQLSRFNGVVEELKKRGICPPLCHIANSPAVVSFTNQTGFNMVRPGIALYGYNPIGNFKTDFNIKPVLRLRSTIRSLREIEEGEGISYGHFFVTNKKIKVATVAIGYGDGYLRGEPNKGVVFVKDKACPILGRICMDACMIDVSEVQDVKIGDVVECINGEYSEQISVETFAKEHNTIPYEITTRMARRLYRIYRYKRKTGSWNDILTNLLFAK